jgi:hypothetical protein
MPEAGEGSSPHVGFAPGLTTGRAPPPSSWSAAFALPVCALRVASGGATMTIPGGAGTYPMRKRSFLRARRTGFYQGSELSRYGAPALRFAPAPIP